MSELAVNPFNATFTTIDTGLKITGSQTIEAIRVKILKHGVIADGTLTLEVLEGAKSIGSASITAAQFNEGLATFAWGYFAFCFDDAISINVDDDATVTDLTLRFTMSGHTPDNDNYIGLIRQFESTFVDEFGTRPVSVSAEEDGWFNPFGIEIYTVEG